MRFPFSLPLSLLVLLSACTHPQPPLVLDASATVAPPKESQDILHRIAFGSCNKTELPQPLFRKLIEEKPDLFIWTGDVIYADTRDVHQLSELYAHQLRQVEYAGFLASKVPVIGTYDDHDYGERDGGKDYPARDESKRLFMDFVNEPKDSPRRQQPGIYTSYRFGPAGKRVKILLTDNRYNREEPGAKTDILGAEQWKWLEEETRTVDSELLLIISGTQVLPDEHKYEKWGDWPKARAHFVEMLNQSPYKNIIVISGDRHLGELSNFKLASGRTIWEVTSSGMTHSYAAATDALSPNKYRVGPMLTRLNYGILDLNWESATPSVSIEVRDINRTPIIQELVPLQK